MTRWSLFSTISKNVASSWDDRVRKMESRQQDAFSESLANQQQQTLEEETRQSRTERIRDAEFETSMMALHETFLQKERSREKAYQDAQLEQQTRHDAREAAFQKLEVLLQDQIDTTWRILELVSPAEIDEEGREPATNMKRYSPIVYGKQKSSTAKAIQSSGSRSHSKRRFPSRGRQGTPSYVPVFVIRESRSPGVAPSSGASYISPDSQQGSIDYTARRWLNPYPREISLHLESGRPPPIEPVSPVVSVMDLPLPPPDPPLTNNYLCTRNSERRAVQDILFWEQEDKAELRFKYAETQRDTAETIRFRAHDAEERRKEHEFRRVMEVNENQFSQREMARNEDGILRSQQFKDDQSYRSQLFKQTLRWENQKHIAAQNCEDGWIKSTTARIEALSNVHKHLVEQVRRHQITVEHSDIMSDQQPDFFDWSCATMIGPDNVPVDGISLRETSSSKDSRPISKKKCSTKRVRRYNSSSGRRPTPEVFKNRRARNQAPLPLSVPMSGPGFIEHMSADRLVDEPMVSRPKPSRSFRKAQVERQKMFVCNTKKRSAIFDSKEPERAQQFFEGQKSRAYRSRQAEDDRQNLFNQLQLHRNERFQEGQEKREASFRQAERRWKQEFLGEIKMCHAEIQIMDSKESWASLIFVPWGWRDLYDRAIKIFDEYWMYGLVGSQVQQQLSPNHEKSTPYILQTKYIPFLLTRVNEPWFAAFLRKKPVLSPELREKRFSEAETRRREAFEESGFEQQQQFLKEEQVQWEGEAVRAAEFEELMTILGDSFLRNQNTREVTLRNWTTEKEGFYEQCEVTRDSRFKSAEDKRESLFREDHDKHLERSKWYSDIRLQHIQRGRHVREKACQQLEEEMATQFETISRFLKDALATTESQHADISTDQTAPGDDTTSDNQKNLSGLNGVVSLVKEEDAVSINQHHVPSRVSGHSPLEYVSISPVSMKVDDPTQGLLLGIQRGIDAVDHVLLGRGDTSATSGRPNYSAATRIPKANEEPITKPPDSSEKMTSPEKGPRSSSDAGTNSYSARFFRDPHFQEFYFSTQEDHRTQSFGSAEAKRDRMEALRTDTFNAAEERRTRQFEVSMNTYEKSLRQSERTRYWREAMRSQQFSTSQSHHSHIYDEHWIWVRKQNSAMHDAEDIWILTAKRRLETLSTLHDTVLAAYRQALIRARPQQRSPSLQYIHDHGGLESLPSTAAPRMPGTFIIQSRLAYSHSRSPSHRRRSRSRSRPPLVIGPVPQTVGFAPQILVTKDLGGAYLPLPGSPDHEHNKKHTTVDAGNEWTSAQRKRQFLFEESQVERSRIFEQGMRHRRSLFETSENRRKLGFKEAQRTRKASSVESEHNRDIKFVRIQAQLEEAFRHGEEERESTFQNAERARAREFQLQQSRRREAFYVAQEELQMQSFEQEDNRASKFNTWWKEMMATAKTMVLREKMLYYTEEQKGDRDITNYIKKSSTTLRNEDQQLLGL
ncbi:hypothetical protein BDZ94DRAFT_1233668 [Collybia nuda]|uniref:Uncharacterized protein n=1 Tax=Collybia nuda TaxID=64659 RepID=A0A9P6CHU0_9AGAR|nr:hypothetical protein BDZ94DRAFT_1233668 [Collybia nuda]